MAKVVAAARALSGRFGREGLQQLSSLTTIRPSRVMKGTIHFSKSNYFESVAPSQAAVADHLCESGATDQLCEDLPERIIGTTKNK